MHQKKLPAMKHKALAYITRRDQTNTYLLVFDHRDFPEAGTQVPAGTVETGESPETAVLREIKEESGLDLQQVRLIRKLATAEFMPSETVRHIFHLIASEELPAEWTHVVRSTGDDDGLGFVYRWIRLPAQVDLAGGQGEWLHLIDPSLH
jgi:8-oxo-dGTP pyrophosphatase MutT (NUDIX family)